MPRPRRLSITITLLAAALAAGTARAAIQTDYDLSWSTVDSGGQTFSSGAGYTLGGTAGQQDAGFLKGGDYTLSGGFWGGGAVTVSHDIYLPLVLRG